MFTGVGGFELGLANNSKPLSEIEQDKERGNRTSNEQGALLCSGQESTFRCVGCSEIDKYSSELLKQKFPTVKNWGDCTKINPSELPDFDMLCGGFPCQSFSIAGKRRGFEDTRGTMFFEVARILKVKRPKLVFLENVKGVLNHDKGKTFSVIIQTLEELGYRTQWMVLNSKFFGVPQNRERVFIIGSLRNEPRPEILPFGCYDQEVNRTANLPSVAIGYDTKDSRPEIGQAKRVYGEKGVICPLNNWSPLTNQNMKIRRLTPTECERLQGFPENWTEGFSDTQRYKMMGNAVSVPVITAIGKKLSQSFINDKY